MDKIPCLISTEICFKTEYRLRDQTCRYFYRIGTSLFYPRSERDRKNKDHVFRKANPRNLSKDPKELLSWRSGKLIAPILLEIGLLKLVELLLLILGHLTINCWDLAHWRINSQRLSQEIFHRMFSCYGLDHEFIRKGICISGTSILELLLSSLGDGILLDL